MTRYQETENARHHNPDMSVSMSKQSCINKGEAEAREGY
jgi:hypothetical protein